MSENIELGYLGQSVEQLQAKVRSAIQGIDVMRDTMITRAEWHADHDKLMARLENVEAEVKYGFRQLQAKIDATNAKIDALGATLGDQIATILARLPEKA